MSEFARQNRRSARILMPVEGAEPMEDAGRLVMAVFPARGVRLRRLTVLRPIAFDFGVSEIPLQTPEAFDLEEEAEKLEARFGREAMEALGRDGLSAEFEIVRGVPVDSILREIEAWSADLVLVRARRPADPEHRLGGLTSALMHHAPVPVLTYDSVPAGYRVRRILIATDFSPSAERAADRALALAESAGAMAHLLYVQVGRGLDARDVEAVEMRAAEELRRWRAGRLTGGGGVPSNAHTVRATSAAGGILRFASELEFDLIVIGVTGRSRAFTAIVGSTARDVVRLASIPVLAVPSRARARYDRLPLLEHAAAAAGQQVAGGR